MSKSNKMRVLTLAAGIVAVGVAGWSGLSAYAATDSGSVTLTGTIAENVSITVTPTGNYNNLDITTLQTVTDELVATVSETANVAYTVSVQSTNLASCPTANTSCLLSGANAIDLALKINGTTISFDSNPKQYKTGSVALTGTTPENVNVTYTIGQSYPAGTYTETYTFTITSV
mgnify:FL=1